jgi:hypothetical protein
MRGFSYVLAALAMISLAYWAYQENFQTQSALKQVEILHGDIGKSRETLSVLKAEWAYLNRPDRLRDLADMNFERLQLIELTRRHFDDFDHIKFSTPDIMGELSDPVDAIGVLPIIEIDPITKRQVVLEQYQ